MSRDVEKKVIVYFFDPYSRAFLAEGGSGDSSDYTLPDNAVIIKPPEIPDGEYAMMNIAKTEWELKKIEITVIDDNGFVHEKIYQIRPVVEMEGKTIIESQPLESLEKARWTGSEWEDKPIPSTLYQGSWNKTLQEWEEGLEGTELSDTIDRETSTLIKDWCIEQDKVEEYYLNLGIADKTDAEYVAYRIQKDTIIAAQKQKKVDTGVA